MIEVVPPNFQLSGLMVNPLVVPLAAGRSTLLSVKYHSKFRDLTAAVLEDLFKPKLGEATDTLPKGMVARNRKLAERIEKKNKEKQDAQTQDPKKKNQPPTAPAKKEEIKKEPALVIPKGKTL